MNAAGENLIPELEKALIGKTVVEAEETDATWMTIRVMKEDGKYMVGDCAMRVDRVNVAVENSRITEILDIG